MKHRLAWTLLIAATTCAGAGHNVTGSKHDLTAGGSGSVKSAVGDACLFCHAPHNVAPNITPLWDHTLSTQTYSTYSSTTYNSGVQTPGAGSSKLCLSCHDGTVAVGQTTAKGILATSGTMSPSDVFGANLTLGHPVSMTPVDDGQLVTSLFSAPPSTKDPAVKLVSGKVECVTCHDPHIQNIDAAAGMFLVRSNSRGAMCLACHEPGRLQPNQLAGWTTSAHASATNTVPANATFGMYGSVGNNACSACHGSHNNGSAPRNLKATEEATCSPCHSGANVSPGLYNIMGELTKTYSHPVTTVTGAHDAKETLPVNTTRHAECADCHNSHTAYAQAGTAVAPAIQGAMAGVSGYDTAGSMIPANYEYQVCYKCHADSTNKPLTSIYGRTAPRYPQGPMPAGYPVQPPMPPDQYNIRLKFASPIGHNVAGYSTVTTSNTTLRPFMLNVDGVTSNTSRPLTTSSIIYCTDCHNNNQARSSNGTGPNGPHGSSFPHLLQMNLFQEPAGGGSSGATNMAALCSKCHNLTNLNNIRPHDPHKTYSCSSCHDPHGVIGGSVATNRGMVNMDTAVASRSTTYFGYFYRGLTTGQRGCYVTCHGKNHNPYTY